MQFCGNSTTVNTNFTVYSTKIMTDFQTLMKSVLRSFIYRKEVEEFNIKTHI